MLEKIALQKNLISKDQCTEALNACRGADNLEVALKDYFISNNLIPVNQMKQLVATYHALKIMRRNQVFGSLAVKLGFVDRDRFRADLGRQKQAMGQKTLPRFIGDIWLKDQTITPDQFKKLRAISRKKQAPECRQPDAPPPVIHGETGEVKAVPPEGIEAVTAPETPDYAMQITLAGGVELEVDTQGMSAFLKKTDQFDDTMTADEILDLMLDHGISYGLVSEENIQGFIRSSGFREKPFKVASGTPAKQGRDARIEYYFDTDHLKAGGLDDEGNIDFKDRGQVPWVEQGTLLAEKFPMSASRNGTTVFGMDVEVPTAVDLPLRFKSGVTASEDDLRLYSETSGHPKLTWSGNIQVTDTFTVKEDVDYQTGHIEYTGDVDIKGTLKAGFKIRGDAVRVNTVDGGEIHAQGDVTIVNGANDARIYARGNVFAKFVQNTEVSCLGHLTVEKEIVDCIVETSGSVRTPNGEVISSRITCNMGLTARHLGTEKSVPNTIILNEDAFTMKELRSIRNEIRAGDAQLAQMREKLDAVSKKLKELTHDTSRLAHEMDRAREEGRGLSDQLRALDAESPRIAALKPQIQKNTALFARLDKDLNTHFDRIETYETQIVDLTVGQEHLEERLEDLLYEQTNFREWQEANPGKPWATITGRVSPGTVIKSPKASREISEALTNVSIKEVRNQDTDKPEIQIHDNIRPR